MIFHSYAFQIIDHATTDNSIDELQSSRRWQPRIGDHVQVIGHDDVSIKRKLSRMPRFIQRYTSYNLDLIGAEDRQAIFSDGCQVITGRVSGDSMHGPIINGLSRKDFCKS